MKTISDKIYESESMYKGKLVKPAMLKYENKPCIVFGEEIKNVKQGNKAYNTAIWLGFKPESKFKDYVEDYGNDNDTYYLIMYIEEDGSDYCTFVESDKVKL